jgi:hypothetical protein
MVAAEVLPIVNPMIDSTHPGLWLYVEILCTVARPGFLGESVI